MKFQKLEEKNKEKEDKMRMREQERLRKKKELEDIKKYEQLINDQRRKESVKEQHDKKFGKLIKKYQNDDFDTKFNLNKDKDHGKILDTDDEYKQL